MNSTTLRLVLVLASAVLWPALTLAGGDAASGQALSQTCAACHGSDGNSTVETNPKLAGQHESYLVQALKSYRSGARQSPIMSGFAAALSDQDIADLAAYYSSQPGQLATVPLR